MKSTWNLAPVLQIVQKIPENYCPCLYLSIDQVWWLNELWFKRYSQKCTLFHVLIYTHRDITDFVNLGIFKDPKTWISWKRNITFLSNKNILSLCLRQYILKVYCFLVEVTFNDIWCYLVIGCFDWKIGIFQQIAARGLLYP